MADLKKGDWVRRISGVSLSTDAGRHDADFVGQIDEVKMESWGMSEIVFTNGHRGLANMYEPWKPKVGDRVRCVTGTSLITKGKEYVVTGVTDSVLWVDRKERGIADYPYEYFEPITAETPVVAEAQPAPLKIEAGKFYRTRDGRKVGPMKASSWSDGWYDESASITSQRWEKDGSYIIGQTTQLDLIAEWTDEPATTTEVTNDNAAPATPKFKVGDVVEALYDWCEVKAGETYTVKAAKDELVALLVDEDGDPWCHMTFGEVKLVEPAPVPPSTPTTTTPTNLTINVTNLADLDAVIAKLKKIRKLQRQIAA